MAISILGFIRPEYDYVSVESLIEDINEDIEVTKRSLDREKWRVALDDEFLWDAEKSPVGIMAEMA
jgi:riboflavin kinase